MTIRMLACVVFAENTSVLPSAEILKKKTQKSTNFSFVSLDLAPGRPGFLVKRRVDFLAKETSESSLAGWLAAGECGRAGLQAV